jgi:hypothetical protein
MMELHLDPPRGVIAGAGLSAVPGGTSRSVPDIALGAGEREAVRAASAYGPTTVTPAGTVNIAGTLFPTPTQIVATAPGFNLVLVLDDGISVTAIEVWRPRDPAADITVRYDGLDVFRTPAVQLLDLLRARGHRIETEDEGAGAWAPDLALGFSRVAEHEVPMGADGHPLYFESVLVTAAGYYGEG